MANFGDFISKNVLPPEVDTFKILSYTPSPRQKVFHDASKEHIYGILYGGAAGGGKSCAFLMDAIYNAMNYPGIRIGCLRRTYPELEESFIAPLGAKWKYAIQLGARWNGTKRLLTFPNGSVINFIYAETVQDVSRIQGSEYQAFYIDEGALMLPAVIQQIEERLRSGDKLIPVIGMRISSTPGGPSHKYLKDRFITPTKLGKIHYFEEIKGTNETNEIAFIPAKVTDNPHLNESYENVLNNIADPQRRAAMRDGDWDAMVGQFFTQWSRSRHTVNAFEIPKEWPRYCGIDYGFAAPWAVLWVAPDNDGRLWAYREIVSAGVQATEQAQYILAAEKASGEPDVIRVADPSMWGSRGTPLSIADHYGLEGCGIYKADNDRINGWSVCHQYLNDGPACDIHRAMGWKTCPMFHVFEETCPTFIETIPALPRNPLKPDDAATVNVEDHIADAWRYVCMSVGTYARPVFYDDSPEAEKPIKSEEKAEAGPIKPAQNYAELFGGNWFSPFGES